jgi:hypothetical protein
MRNSYLLTLALGISLGPCSECQNEPGPIDRWLETVSHTQAEQPHWIAPVFTATARLEQMYVYDISQQSTAKGDLTNFGGGRGLLLIPAEHINVVTTPPAYFAHQNGKIKDGFGDLSFLLKYRLAAANEQQGNYVATAFLSTSIPTGTYNTGAPHALITPSFGFGKGWGHFDVQSTVGIGIPVADRDKLGTPVSCNAAFQYVFFRKLWPELEINSTIFPNGPNAGNAQVFLSPGLVLGKFHLWRRLGFAVGGGVQIATTHFHTLNHNRILSLRFPF